MPLHLLNAVKRRSDLCMCNIDAKQLQKQQQWTNFLRKTKCFFTIIVVFHVKKHARLIKLFPPPNYSNYIDPALYFVVFSGFYSPILLVFLFFGCFFSNLNFLRGLFRSHHLSERKRSFVFFLPQDFAS